jgi:hypothetical protein
MTCLLIFERTEDFKMALHHDVGKLMSVIRESGLRRAGQFSLFALRERIMGQMDRRSEGALGMSIQKWTPMDSLQVESSNKQFAFCYVPSPRLVVNALIRSLPEELTEFSFVDIGSGEGRMLIVALEFPFREIIGVEFAKELHATAVRNIASASTDIRDANRCRSILIDATEYEIPGNECIVYFNNPFSESVFAKVVDKLKSVYERCGKTVYILYSQPCRGLDDNRTENVELLRATDWLAEQPVELPTWQDRLLLGSYELHVFRTSKCNH